MIKVFLQSSNETLAFLLFITELIKSSSCILNESEYLSKKKLRCFGFDSVDLELYSKILFSLMFFHLQHSFTPKNFNSLVVAINRSSRIINYTYFTFIGFKNRYNCIMII